MRRVFLPWRSCWVYASWRCLCTNVTRLHIEHEFWSWLIFFSLSPPNIECHRKLVLQRGPQCHYSIKHIHLSIQIKYQKMLYSPVGKGTCAYFFTVSNCWVKRRNCLDNVFLLQYIHHSSVSQTSVVMLTKLCRYFCNSLGSPWIRIRKTTSQNEHPPCQAREPAHAFCGSHCVYAKFDCVALCKEKSIIGFRVAPQFHISHTVLGGFVSSSVAIISDRGQVKDRVLLLCERVSCLRSYQEHRSLEHSRCFTTQEHAGHRSSHRSSTSCRIRGLRFPSNLQPPSTCLDVSIKHMGVPELHEGLLED